MVNQVKCYTLSINKGMSSCWDFEFEFQDGVGI